MRIKNTIPKIYRRQTLDCWLFGYVIGQQQISGHNNFNITKCLLDFQKSFGLSEDEFPLDTALMSWYRMSKEWLDEQKT